MLILDPSDWYHGWNNSLLMFMANLPSASSAQEYKLSSSTFADAKDMILTAS